MDQSQKQVSTKLKVVSREELEKQTGNVYKSISIIAKRSAQLKEKVKQELHSKLEEFTTPNDGGDDSVAVENKERIEVARYYEGLPKPHQIALDEFLNEKVYFRHLDKTEE